MQETIRIVKSPVTPRPEDRFSTPVMEHADPALKLSVETDQGEQPVPEAAKADPEPAISQMGDSRLEIEAALEVETIIAEAIVEAVVEIAGGQVSDTAVGGEIEFEVGEKSEIVEMGAQMDVNPGQVDSVVCDPSFEGASAEGQPKEQDAGGAERESIQKINPQEEAEASHPIQSKTDEETPHVKVKVVEGETPHPKEQLEPADTATPWLPGTKSIGSTTTAVESKRPESLAETLYERSTPGTQKSDLRSRSRAKSHVEKTEQPVEPSTTTVKDQIPTSVPAPAPQTETKPKPSEPKESNQQKRIFAAPGDDFDTDNEPSWAWEELLKQIDEEDRRYQEQRNAVDVNMWWISFELAWEANLKKGRPLRTWLDVEKNWPKEPEWEKDVKESEAARDPSRLPKKVPDQYGEKSSEMMNADSSVPAPGPTTANPSPRDGKGSTATSASSTRKNSSSSLPNTKQDKDCAPINPHRSSQGSLKGDIWTMWKETEQRWAEEERIEKEKKKTNSVKPAPAPASTAHEPPHSKTFPAGVFPRSRYSRRSDHPISSAWQDRARQQEEGRTESARNTQQSKQHTYPPHSQQQQAPVHPQAHAQSEPYSQWRPRQSSAAQTAPPPPPPPPPQPNTTQPSGYQSRRDTHPGTQSRPTAHHKKEPRVPLKIRIPETPMGTSWKAYEARWEVLLNSQGPISFSSVPWPTQHRPADPTAITIYNIAAFLLSPEHSKEMNARDRLRGAVRRWHTDKFTRFASRILPDDKAMIDEGVGIVARALTQLLELEKKRTN